MSKTAGRKVVLSWGGTPIGTARTKSISVSNSLIDFTDDSSNGNAEYDEIVGRRDVTFSVEGVYINNGLEDDALDEDISNTLTFTYPDGRSLSCSARINSYESASGGSDAEQTFSAEFTASGEITPSAGGSGGGT